jgi:DNA-binding transcriptional ArsR family regulator
MPPDVLSLTFAALADPTRRAILQRLVRGETSVKELARPFRMSAPAVSKHPKVLERVGLVRRSRRSQWRPCRLNPQPLRRANDWLEPYR